MGLSISIADSSGRKAQVWYIDFMVGLLIMITAAVIYFNFYGNLSDDSESDWQELIIDSKSISSALMSSGSPPGWNASNASSIGITDGNYRINTTKFEYLKSMEYADAKAAFKTRFDFHIFIKGADNSITDEYGINSTSPKLLVQTARFAIYNSTIQRVVLHLWKN